ncbi:unnamed protein product [Closterium sp. NIES-54]
MHDSDDAAAGSSSARDGAGGGHSGGGDNGGGGESERDGSSESGREQDSSSANDGASDQGTQGSDPGGGGTDITPDGSSSSSGGSSSGSGTSGAAGEGDPSEAVEQRNEHAIRRIRYPQGARQGDMRAGERGGGSADAGGEAAAAAQPSAPAPASAPAVAVDPLEEQFVSGELTLAVLHQAQAHTLTLTRTRTRAHVRRPPACAALNACHTIPSTPSKLCRTTPQRRSPSPTPHHSSPGQVQQLARAGVVAARETEVKAVVRRRAAVGFPGISQYSEVNSGTAPTYNHSVVREKNDSPCLSFLVWTGYHTARWSGGTWDRHLPLLLASITHCSFVASVVSSCGAAAGVCEWHGMAWHGCVAASTDADPTQPWSVFFIPGSNDGNNSNPDWGAPLYYNTSKLTTLQDYPQIGTDAHGVFVSVNQFGLEESKYFGANIYAMGKEQLARTCTASILRVAIPYSPALTSPSYTVYPHKVPADGSYDTANNGTMYFGYMGVNFNGAPDEIVLVPNVTIIGAFALTGTSALGSIEAVDRVVPHIAAVETPPFFLPMSVRQRPGPTPTAWRFNRREAAIDAFAAGMQAVLVQPQRHTMWLAFTSAFGPALGSSSVVLAKIRLRLREEASGEVASGEASGEVASGEVSGEVASGEASGEVASGEASGEVASGEASGEVASGEASGEVASGEASGEVASGEASGEVASAEASGEVASGEASGEVASGEASGEVASGDALGEVACGEPSSEVVMNGTVGETEAVEAASGGWSFEVQLEGFKAVGVQGNSLLRPAMALNRRGRGILAAALAGPSFYPSAAYALVDSTLRVGPVTVAAPGGAPLDDYSGYLFEERAMRYGDYHTATTDEHGNAWAVVEYVPGVPRTEWTNWATYIFKVQL